MQRLDDKTINQIKELRDKGMTYEQIAKQCSVSSATVQRYANPTKKSKPHKPNVSFSEALENNIRGLIRAEIRNIFSEERN